MPTYAIGVERLEFLQAHESPNVHQRASALLDKYFTQGYDMGQYNTKRCDAMQYNTIQSQCSSRHSIGAVWIYTSSFIRYSVADLFGPDSHSHELIRVQFLNALK